VEHLHCIPSTQVLLYLTQYIVHKACTFDFFKNTIGRKIVKSAIPCQVKVQSWTVCASVGSATNNKVLLVRMQLLYLKNMRILTYRTKALCLLIFFSIYSIQSDMSILLFPSWILLKHLIFVIFFKNLSSYPLGKFKINTPSIGYPDPSIGEGVHILNGMTQREQEIWRYISVSRVNDLSHGS
jgi:hypothetical protein